MGLCFHVGGFRALLSVCISHQRQLTRQNGQIHQCHLAAVFERGWPWTARIACIDWPVPQPSRTWKSETSFLLLNCGTVEFPSRPSSTCKPETVTYKPHRICVLSDRKYGRRRGNPRGHLVLLFPSCRSRHHGWLRCRLAHQHPAHNLAMVSRCHPCFLPALRLLRPPREIQAGPSPDPASALRVQRQSTVGRHGVCCDDLEASACYAISLRAVLDEMDRGQSWAGAFSLCWKISSRCFMVGSVDGVMALRLQEGFQTVNVFLGQ